MAQIGIEGMKFYAYHGVYPEERLVGGHYIVDVYLTGDISQAAQTDDLTHTFNYEIVLNVCDEVMKTPCKLIEHVAQKILDELYRQLGAQSVEHIKVRVSKLSLPVAISLTRTFVELER